MKGGKNLKASIEVESDLLVVLRAEAVRDKKTLQEVVEKALMFYIWAPEETIERVMKKAALH